MTLLIRPERPADEGAVQAVIAAAFAVASEGAGGPGPDGAGGRVVEVGLNDELRRDPSLVPALTLVAERDGAVVGQLTSSYGTLVDLAGGPAGRVVGVGPVAVLPAEQGTGVGSALVTDLVVRARRAGELALVLLGDPGFYGRFGFGPAAAAGIGAPDPAWGEHFQALVLRPDGLPTAARFEYAAPFDGL